MAKKRICLVIDNLDPKNPVNYLVNATSKPAALAHVVKEPRFVVTIPSTAEAVALGAAGVKVQETADE